MHSSAYNAYRDGQPLFGRWFFLFYTIDSIIAVVHKKLSSTRAKRKEEEDAKHEIYEIWNDLIFRCCWACNACLNYANLPIPVHSMRSIIQICSVSCLGLIDFVNHFMTEFLVFRCCCCWMYFTTNWVYFISILVWHFSLSASFFLSLSRRLFIRLLIHLEKCIFQRDIDRLACLCTTRTLSGRIVHIPAMSAQPVGN